MENYSELRAAALKAVASLQEVLEDQKSPPRDRIQAAKLILKYSMIEVVSTPEGD